MTIKEIRQYAKEHTFNEICEHFQKSKGYMSEILNDYNIEYVHISRAGRPRQKCPFEAEIVADYKSGATLKEMAYKFHRSREGVRFILNRAGVYENVRHHPVDLEELKFRLRKCDTKNMTIKEIYYTYCSDMCTLGSFYSVLDKAGIPYKRLVNGNI